MIGLPHGVVGLAPHDETWAAAFADERRRIAGALPGCEIEHVGSTSVPGLVAKPILDVAIGHPPGAPAGPSIAALEALGYHYGGDAGAAGGHVLSLRPTPELRTHHLHLVALDDPQWVDYLLFRDHLRAHPEARAAYAAVKRELAARFPNDRRAYTAGKHDVVQRLLGDARSVSAAAIRARRL